jgi:hypothetical protein
MSIKRWINLTIICLIRIGIRLKLIGIIKEDNKKNETNEKKKQNWIKILITCELG